MPGVLTRLAFSCMGSDDHGEVGFQRWKIVVVELRWLIQSTWISHTKIVERCKLPSETCVSPLSDILVESEFINHRNDRSS